MLELKNISKTYEGKPLLKDISFTVKAGETVCLLGASGSGKSTLLRIIAGLENPESGRVSFNGNDLASTPPHARDFGLVFQHYELFPHLNVFDNVAFGLKMGRRQSLLPSAQESASYTEKVKLRVASLLEQVGLTGFEKRKVTELSGGEQQRVALARALAPQPRLLMFDEPLGALDRTLKEDLLNELRDILHQTKIPAIYVTHDQEEAFAIGDRILILHDGIIVREGTPADVWSNPRSAWVARFLGVGNVLDGVAVAPNKVKTNCGIFHVNCRRKKGERVPMLLREADGEEGEELKLKVEDVIFKRELFEVRARGGIVIHMEEKPKIGQIVRVRVKVECLS
jgi:ABC-type Fe3+/spermidine/putrescine transport system ATPase subunit